MPLPKLNTAQFQKSLARLLRESLSLKTSPSASLVGLLGTLTFRSSNLAAHEAFSMFRELHAVGKGYTTDPQSNNLGTIASLEIHLIGTLYDGHQTSRHFASLDLLPDGEIAFIRFGDEASDTRIAA
jgi:hypothetical protein